MAGSVANIKKIPIKGTVVKLKALGGAKTEKEIDCIRGNLTIDYGTYDVQENLCHYEGYVYDKSNNAKFGEFNVQGWFDGDKADDFQTLLFQALNNEGDFDDTTTTGDRKAQLTFAFPDANNNKIEVVGFVTHAESEFDLSGYLTLDFTFKQIKRPTLS